MRRDFTYIDDVVESVVRLIDRAARGQSKLFEYVAGSGLEQRAVAHLQYRQQQAGRASRGRAAS